MKIEARHIVAVLLLAFAWKGASLEVPWPPGPVANIVTPKPEPALLVWAEPLRPIVSGMLPADRKYLANFYDAMVFVLMRDAGRDEPICSTVGKFAEFHAGSLQLAIDRQNVGKYPGLGEAIDQVFVNAVGADDVRLEASSRTKLTAACGVLSWVFQIHRDE